MSAFYDMALVEEIPVRLLRRSLTPLRTEVVSVEELVNSIKQFGLLQPLVVRPLHDGFEIVAGNRRFMACRSLRWSKVPCVIKNLDDKEAFELALTENLERENLNPIEEATAFRKYVVDNGWGSVSDLAKKLGKSTSYISQRLSLLKLPKDILLKIAAKEISPSSARELMFAKSTENLYFLASMASKGAMSSREIHEYARSMDGISWSNNAREEIDKDYKALKKCVLILRIAMTRVSSLLDRVEDETTREYLFCQRNSLHDMIDRTIRLSLKRKSSQKNRLY